MKKTGIKQIVLILVSAVVFMSVFFMSNNLINSDYDGIILSHTFNNQNMNDTVNKNDIYSNINSAIKLDTIAFDSIISISIIPEVKILTENEELLFVLSVEEKNKNVFWKSYKIQNQIKEIGEWQKLIIVQNFNKFIFKKNYIVKTYFWNTSESMFKYKSVKINFFDKEKEMPKIIFQEN